MALLPGIGSTDPRQPADPEQSPWSAVLRLQIAGVSRCTAVMVAPDLAATAAHCLWNKPLGRIVPATSVHLLFAYDAGAYARHARAVEIILPPAAEPGAPATRGDDLALLRIAPTATDTLAPLATPLPPGTELAMAGYGQDRAQRLTVDPSCRVLGPAQDAAGRPLLQHSCAGTRGTSGGPLLVHTPAGWALAGIQVAGERDGAGGMAIPAATVRRLMDRR